MNDFISREALKKKLQARYDNGEEDFDKGYNIGIETAIELLDNAPTVEERPQGEWHEHLDKGLLKARHENYVVYDVDYLLDNLAREVSIMESARKMRNCGADMRKGGAKQ